MSTPAEIAEVVQALMGLPADKVTEVHDFVLFLKDRLGKQAKPSDIVWDWSAEDIHDLNVYLTEYAEQEVPWDEPPDPHGGQRRQRVVDISDEPNND